MSRVRVPVAPISIHSSDKYMLPVEISLCYILVDIVTCPAYHVISEECMFDKYNNGLILSRDVHPEFNNDPDPGSGGQS
ncbi:hypothetical protein M8J75_004514 [Diaphorina citri]|nr:hypothetical protein M8J75_004514 [Diaphorina citri]